MEAELACVILSFRNEPYLAAAVRSILTQDGPPIEVVVVDSGGQDPTHTLRRAGIDVPVIHRNERLYVGGVRNLGIEATHAPYIAFLAADCVAMPGWAANRLRAHRAGAPAVASAIVNAYPQSYCAWASYILRYATRMPGTPIDKAMLFSVSYARALFERFGRFRSDLRIGEDTEFHNRFAGTVRIEWTPGVRTAHRHPTNIYWLLCDEYVRGGRMARFCAQIDGRASAVRFALGTVRDARESLSGAWQWCDASWRPHIRRAYPLAVPAAAAYTLGALLSNCGRPRLAWMRRVRVRPVRPDRA
jgi:glycosyltransferase involved in cell wall biosynthesis